MYRRDMEFKFSLEIDMVTRAQEIVDSQRMFPDEAIIDMITDDGDIIYQLEDGSFIVAQRLETSNRVLYTYCEVDGSYWRDVESRLENPSYDSDDDSNYSESDWKAPSDEQVNDEINYEPDYDDLDSDAYLD